MRKLSILFLLFSFSPVWAQVFENDSLKILVKRSADHIYNADPDSANFYIDLVDLEIPDHPVVPLMRAMTLLWANIPTITEELFVEMTSSPGDLPAGHVVKTPLDFASKDVAILRSKDPAVSGTTLVFEGNDKSRPGYVGLGFRL